MFLFSQPLIKFYAWQHRFSSNEEWKSGTPKIISLLGDSDYDTLFDPLKGFGLKTAAAWEKRDWQVRSFFKTGNFDKETHYNLFLSGLTPYARVYLNNTFLFESDNYFKAYNYTIEKLIKRDAVNELRIDLPSPTLNAELEYKKDAINYPSDNEESNKKVSQFLRMPPMCFGWDICPRLMPDRLPKEIYIRRWDKMNIENLYVTTDSISTNKAYLKLEAEIESDFTGLGEIELAIADGNNIVLKKTETIQLKKGKNNFEKKIELQEIKLWFPNGLSHGKAEEPFLYKVFCKISSGNIQVTKEENFGIRKVNLIREKDVFGENFYFKVNGEKIFIKGANYVPDLLDFQRNYSTKKFKETILKAKDAGFIMIRVWGGGNYLNEEQLNICDEAGIMVWQDFIFSGTMYPGNEKFLKNVQEEAIHQVKAYKKHPCLALWCGNNEIEVAWKNWGWQEKYKIHGKDSIHLWKAYKKIFNEILPNTIRKYDPGTSYIS
ncbi:MAG: glycosyl hydrolase 2 galactose-binding domain-containing protein, partial [Bacteroidota bacterium]